MGVVAERLSQNVDPANLQPEGPFQTRAVVLVNPRNLCYMNASFVAMLRALSPEDLPGGLRQLRALCQRAKGRPLNLSNQLVVHSMLRGGG